jgi:transcriptional regulator
MSPATRERAHRLAAKYLAKILRVNQAAVSKIERRADMEVSTLRDFVKAMGGELKITAKFPEGTVEITQFEVVKKAAAGKD